MIFEVLGVPAVHVPGCKTTAFSVQCSVLVGKGCTNVSWVKNSGDEGYS